MEGKISKIVVACDSFKGTLSSAEICDITKEAINRYYRDCKVVAIPVADGGEGTTEAIARYHGAKTVECNAVDPLGRPIKAKYAISNDLAIVEAAEACGLTLVPTEQRNPRRATSRGVGMMIADAMSRGISRFVIGIGGTATIDAGTGLLEALGYRFRDSEGNVVEGCGETLGKIETIDSTNILPRVECAEFTIACDVDSPLLGPTGAARMFGPQKGATPADVELLEQDMGRFARLLAEITGRRDVANIAGGGAAGGIGLTLNLLLGASLKRGVDMVLETIGFDDLISDADLVITGEGKIDAQTLKGKTPAGVAEAAGRHGIPCIILAGQIDDREQLAAAGLTNIYSINDPAILPQHPATENQLDPSVAAARLANAVTVLLAQSEIGRESV